MARPSLLRSPRHFPRPFPSVLPFCESPPTLSLWARGLAQPCWGLPSPAGAAEPRLARLLANLGAGGGRQVMKSWHPPARFLADSPAPPATASTP